MNSHIKTRELLPSSVLPDRMETVLHFIPYALPLTIKAAMLSSKLEQQVVGLQGGPEHKHTAIEAVRPARIRSCRELLSIKQLINIAKYLKESREREKKKVRLNVCLE